MLNIFRSRPGPASFSQEDKHWLLGNTNGKPMNSLDEALVTTAFDAESDQDVVNIKKNMATIKTIKRLCFIKLVVFIPEHILTRLLFNKQKSNKHLTLTKLYYRLLFNKISLVEFNKNLISLTKDSIIL
jgi:hypothetical protein